MIDYLAVAASLMPTLYPRPILPVSLVEVQADPHAFQGWKTVPAGEPAQLAERTFGRNTSVILDFGEHLVGHVQLHLSCQAPNVDAPTRVKLIFAEVPSELGESFDPYPGELSRAWLQDEIFTFDDLPAVLRPPRRYAFRYLKIVVIDTCWSQKLKIDRVVCDAVSSADESAVAPLPPGLPADVQALDIVSRRTLRNCMQSIFEDGPKRDRRLWLGDLRLQALANYLTFRNYPLVKRCLYLFAGLPRPDGIVGTDLYWTPPPHRGGCSLLDYPALFIPSVLEYAQASNDWAAAAELWPVIRNQLRLFDFVDSKTGLFSDAPKWNQFIDWREGLHKQAAMHALLLYCARQAVALAGRLNQQSDLGNLPALVEKMTAAARDAFYDADRRLFVSGLERQVSWATQAWMTLAGVVSGQDAQIALRAVMADPAALRPAGPYLYHYFAEALFRAGLAQEAVALIRQYWGGMVDRGASTFWEIYDPADEKLSPYKSHLVNSYCHAWSCTPAWFIRTWPEAFRT